jgi:hypothetical protein
LALIPQSYQLSMLALMMLSGLIAWAAGYRLFRTVLTLFGFIFGAWFASSVFGASDKPLLVLAALGGGAVGALIMFFGYFVGVALGGAGIGVLTAHMLWSRIGGGDPRPVLVILAAVAGAASAMVLQRYVTIVATAFGGAWILLLSGLTLIDRGQKIAGTPEVWVLYPLDPSPGRQGVLTTWAVLGLAGVFIQLRSTSHSKPKVKNT